MANRRAPSRSRPRRKCKNLGAIDHYFAEFEHSSAPVVQSNKWRNLSTRRA